MKLIIEDDEGRKTVVPLVREEITIGRQDGNTIRLTERNVSRRHARLVKENGNLLIEDLGSYNGVRVNGEKITEKTKIKEGDLVEIGDYDLGIQGKIEASTTPTAVPKQQTVPPGQVKVPAKPAAQAAPPPAAPPPQAQAAAAEPEPPPAPAPQAAAPAPSAGGATAIIRVSDIMKQAPQVEVRDLQRNEMPRLVGLSGPARGKEMYLQKTEVKFGRTDENDLSFDHQSVSRQHARFVLDQGQWKVIDNKSANGVRINGEDYAVSNIKPGDTIELGHLKFRFCAPGEKFVPPPDTSGEHQKATGPRPTTAELIAGASQPGRMATSPGVPSKKKGAPVGLIAGIVGAIVVIGVVAFLVIGKRGGEAGTGEDAVKQADALAKQHKYIAAMDMFEKAGDAPTPTKKKISEESHGEETYNAMKEAVDSGDGDKARAQFEKCAAETTYWCGKAGEMKEQVGAAYAKKHLAIASAARSSGDNAKCQSEAGLVLAFDSANAEAQSLQSSCAPQQKEETTAKPPPQKHEASGAEKEARAAKLTQDCTAKLNPAVKDFNGSVKSAQAALALNPGDKATQAAAYRCLGYSYAYLGDMASAKKWLEKYLPYCTNDCPQVHAYTGK